MGMGLAVALHACGGEDGVGPGECSPGVARVELDARAGRTTIPRIGDGLRITASAVDECDRAVAIPSTLWTSDDPSVVEARSVIAITGEQVSEVPGEGFAQAVGFGATVVRAEVQGVVGALPVEVVRPPTRGEGLELLGGDSVARGTTDLWVHGAYAYTGTSVGACGVLSVPCSSVPGSLVVWRLDPDKVPSVVDSVRLPGPHTNDVKVSPRGDYLVASQEANAATNGVVVLDLADPAAPVVIAHFTDGLENGVHNVWIEPIDGTDYLFVVEDGGGAQHGLHVLDLSDPSDPRRVARYAGGDSQVHDVYVRDGLAFVSHWDDGLVILDVGHGVRGGSPSAPVLVSELQMAGGNTHNAWYWPEAALVFVGEERLSATADSTDVGRLHVVDVSDLSAPVEIASYRIPGETPHNFWLDEENGVLYAAWYDRGVRVLDVKGTLAGDLAGREIGFLEPSASRGLGSIWAPQLHEGVLYLSDRVHGVWAVRPVG